MEMAGRDAPGILKELNQKKAQEEEQRLKNAKLNDTICRLHHSEEIQGVWMDRSQQDEDVRKQYAGFGAWFGDGHGLTFGASMRGDLQTNNTAELPQR